MHRLMLSAAALALIALAMTNSAQAGGASEAGELEAARANARAGGPTNARDKELLDRWGCLSGTKSAYCSRQQHRASARIRTR